MLSANPWQGAQETFQGSQSGAQAWQGFMHSVFLWDFWWRGPSIHYSCPRGTSSMIPCAHNASVTASGEMLGLDLRGVLRLSHPELNLGLASLSLVPSSLLVNSLFQVFSSPTSHGIPTQYHLSLPPGSHHCVSVTFSIKTHAMQLKVPVRFEIFLTCIGACLVLCLPTGFDAQETEPSVNIEG